MRKFALFCMLAMAISIQATTLRIELIQGEDLDISINKIGRIVFNNTQLEFVDYEGNILVTKDASEISKLTFHDYSSSYFFATHSDIRIYPNPSSDIVIIDGLNEPAKISLYNLSGQVIKSEIGTQLRVSDVSQGSYLLFVNNQVVKLIKQ